MTRTEAACLSRRTALGLAVGLMVSGCVSVPVDELPPSIETLKVLREQGVPPLALGLFDLGKGVSGRAINIRGSDMHPPKGMTFASFLGATFETELRAAGKLDPAAPLQLAATLTESRCGENMAKGNAQLGARVRLLRAGQAVFEKDYRAESSWKSDFIGALAIPDAFRNYNALYAQLVRQVFADPAFIAAARQ